MKTGEWNDSAKHIVNSGLTQSLSNKETHTHTHARTHTDA